MLRRTAVGEYLSERFSGTLFLGDLGIVADCSGSQVSRLFANRMGVSVHRHLVPPRLRRAMAEIAEGCENLACLPCAPDSRTTAT